VNVLVTVQTYPVLSDAEIARARLAADGISAVIRADNEGGLNPGFYREYGVRLEVDPVDLDDALESLGVEQVLVPLEIAKAMAMHAMTSLPNEACGLVMVDADDALRLVCCMTNTDASPSRFTIDPAEHHGAIRFSEARGWRIGAVFHSHVRTESIPSASDLSGGADPEWLHFIIGPVIGRKPALRAYRFTEGRPVEVSVTVGA
jgi:proteasome lid subunit RPN8/RPN11